MQQAGTAKAHRKRRFAMARSVFALVLREMSTTYGRSPGGYIWAILEPVAAIALFSLAFSFMVRHPPLGRSFALFYASGFLPLAAYQALAANVGGAIRFSKPLLAYPTVTYIDAIVARVFLTMLTHTLVFIIVSFPTVTIFISTIWTSDLFCAIFIFWFLAINKNFL